jgi:hypothetical protein
MEIRKISAVFDNIDEIKPKGFVLVDKNGEERVCPDCHEGILFLDIESPYVKCTKCSYTRRSK